MKTFKNLFNRLISFENLLSAAHKAARGKHGRKNVLTFFVHLEENLFSMQNELINMTYRPGGYRVLHIYDPKPRLISVASFRDRVVHHAVCNIIGSLFERSFIFDSYANRKNKGTHSAISRAQHFIRHNRYVLKCDIKKYFASIDHILLKQDIGKKIADARLLEVINIIIDGSNEQEFVNDLFPGDDLLTPLERRKGLPLGNLTSQFFANLFLNGLDHFIKETLHARCYVRYVDDLLVAANSKEHLLQIKDQIDAFLVSLRLKLHPNKCAIFRNDHGVPFLGQVIYPEFKLLRNQNVKRFCKRLAWKGKLMESGIMSRQEFNASINGWRGHALQADTYKLRQALQNKFSRYEIDLLG